eukprot:CAMPEP_0176368494 /NCGR_PEP_ID=MMETSP0126-20121128/22637_1 /TAXON_ID=141414 ORGANISM="Strombidinopsis acuminatum, Strain SPMC142" /NCGR_SAMPLE_ID=MMETSP0126 /ASSEMBLY_ACC=CAM_ASM_000229 /LENGTH=44 /DNA_ID= /DNA_START= /DNA_END= /DNA_ORIENTATION=
MSGSDTDCYYDEVADSGKDDSKKPDANKDGPSEGDASQLNKNEN